MDNVKALFGIKSNDMKAAEDLQKIRTNQEQKRQADLTAEEAAQRKAVDSGRSGRSLLAFTPAANAGAQDKLGG